MYFGRCSSELVLLPHTRGRCNHYSVGLHDFSVTISRCYKNVYVNSFFPCIARLWSYLPVECSSVTYDLKGFNSGLNRHFFFLVSSQKDFPLCCTLFLLLFLVPPCLLVSVQQCIDLFRIFFYKKK